MKQNCYSPLFICLICILIVGSAKSQNWLTTGNTGTNANSNFLGTIDNKAFVLRTNNLERGRLQANGTWKFGFNTNNATIDSAGILKFSGTGGYQVEDDKYVFQNSSHTKYGLFFNAAGAQYEFRDSFANVVFSINDHGNGALTGALKIGAYTLPAIDGTSGQVLKTNGQGVIAWNNDNNTTYTAGTGITISGNTISNSAKTQWSASGKNIYYNNGKVGIGTDSPTASLEVKGNALFTTLQVANNAYINGLTVGLGSNAIPRNTAIGEDALVSNTTGSLNTAIGYQVLYSNNTGTFNTAVGGLSFRGNISGNGNVSIGHQTLYENTGGDHNTACGTAALFSNTTGNYNTALGYFANVRSGKILTNATAIGANAEVAYSNTMMFGDTLVTDWGFGDAAPAFGFALVIGTTSKNGNGAKVTEGGVWTNASDKNLKEDFQIQDAQQILNKVKSLPVTRWKYKGTNKEYHIGPVAQDFYKLFDVGMDDKSISTIDPSGVALLAIQALSKQNDELKSEVAELKSLMLQFQQNFANCDPCDQSTANGQQSILISGASLLQNIPNPFNHTTTINYILPQRYTSAKIIVIDKAGRVLKDVSVSGNGKSSLQIDASTLANGAYNYSLYVDGKFIATRQMEHLH